MNFTLSQINAFTVAYQQGSYSAASRMLNRSRSSIRELIMQLEDNLGLKLFTTRGHTAIPTEMGHFLYRRARIINRLNDEIISLAQTVESEPEKVNILYDTTLTTGLFAMVERKAAHNNPHLQINWLHRNRQESIDALLDGSGTLAIMTMVRQQPYPDNNQLDILSLGSIPLGVYARPDSPLTRGCVSIPQLQLEKQYICENHQSASLQISQISPDFRIVSNNDLLAEFIQHQGWGILPRPYAQPYVDDGCLVELYVKELAKEFYQPISLYFHTGQNSTTVANLKHWITEYTRQHWH